MKTLALFSLSLAVALGMPPFAPGVAQNPVLTEREQSPLLGDRVPLQGHVVVEDPVPQIKPRSEEQKEAPVPVDMKPSMVGLETKVKPQVREEQEGEVKKESKNELDVKAEPDVKEDLEANVEPEVNLNPEVMAELNADVEPEVEMEPELNDDPEFKVKSEVKVEPDVQEEFQVQMNHEAEIETGREIEERHIDMEGKYENVGESIMELEPLEDKNTELSDEEKSLKATFQNQDPVNNPLSEEGQLLMSEMDYALDGKPIMELEPLEEEHTELSAEEKSMSGTFQDQNPVNKPLSEEGQLLMSEMDYALDGKPIMELEPLEEEHTELSAEEKSMSGTFQDQNPVNKPLSEEGQLLMSEMDYALDGKPIMELEPLEEEHTELSAEEKSMSGTFQDQNPVNKPLSEEGQLLMSEMDYVLDGEPIMELEPLEEEHTELSEEEKSMSGTFQDQDPVNKPLSEEEVGLIQERDNVSDEEPIMELEPLDDDNTELSEVEKPLRAAFQNQNPVSHPLPEEGELPMGEKDYVLAGEPIMELQPMDENNQ